MNPKVSYWLRVIWYVSVGSFIHCNKHPILVSDFDNERDYVCVGAGDIWEISVLPSPVYCELNWSKISSLQKWWFEGNLTEKKNRGKVSILKSAYQVLREKDRRKWYMYVCMCVCVYIYIFFQILKKHIESFKHLNKISQNIFLSSFKNFI